MVEPRVLKGPRLRTTVVTKDPGLPPHVSSRLLGRCKVRNHAVQQPIELLWNARIRHLSHPLRQATLVHDPRLFCRNRWRRPLSILLAIHHDHGSTGKHFEYVTVGRCGSPPFCHQDQDDCAVCTRAAHLALGVCLACGWGCPQAVEIG